MSDTNNPGTPKVVIEADALFGGKKTEQITVDSNRLNPISEADAKWLDALAIPPRFADQLLQMLTWVSGSGFVSSVVKHVPIPQDWAFPGFLVVFVPIVACAYAYTKFPRLRLFVTYRLVLVGVGIYAGVWR